MDSNVAFKCEFCGTKISWNGSDEHNGNIWECEKCGDMFCTKCAKAKGLDPDKDDRVLCPNCDVKHK